MFSGQVVEGDGYPRPVRQGDNVVGIGIEVLQDAFDRFHPVQALLPAL
jgi:hypothetical protein